MGKLEAEPEKSRAKAWLLELERTLVAEDIAGTLELFGEECYWRDLVAFTWNIYTAETRDEIKAMLEATLAQTKPSSFQLEETSEQAGIIQAFFTFETGVARGRGIARLQGEKCWILTTSIHELKGYEEAIGARRPFRAASSTARTSDAEPYCVIVGGGQAGISLAARLKHLDVPAIVVDKNHLPGDSWRNRYSSLNLHTPLYSDHFAYLKFPADWPVFPSASQLADWLQSYTVLMGVEYWTRTECLSAEYDDANRRWTVLLNRGGEQVVLRPAQLVLATGMSGFSKVPSFPGADTFTGVQMHSSQYKDGASWRGKLCVVIGASSSGHDICADLWNAGASQVTMVQRGSTIVSSLQAMDELFRTLGFSEENVDTHDTHSGPTKCDLVAVSAPYKLIRDMHLPLVRMMQKRDSMLVESLHKIGFQCNYCEDEAGLFANYARQLSGDYIDLGASQLLIAGKIKLKSRVSVTELRPRSVVFDDGTEVPADLVVYATGYGSATHWVAKLISEDVGDKVGRVWGLGSGFGKDTGPWEGEIRNMWKPTHQPGLWFHGGGLNHTRIFSAYLAIQIKARQLGICMQVYGMSEVHHLR